jgi:hypothetical protein
LRSCGGGTISGIAAHHSLDLARHAKLRFEIDPREAEYFVRTLAPRQEFVYQLAVRPQPSAVAIGSFDCAPRR